MLEELVSNAEWNYTLPGIKVCEFACEISAGELFTQADGHAEAILCSDGNIRIFLSDGETITARSGDVLLLTDGSRIRSVSSDGKPACGILVYVTPEFAYNSLTQLSQTLGGLSPDIDAIKHLMNKFGGVAVISGGAWSESLFSALSHLPECNRAQYCVLKTLEMLYLLSGGSVKPKPTESADDHTLYQMSAMAQMCEYISANLSDDLSISCLAARFHISPTELKSHFRATFGVPIHQYVTSKRLESAANLLVATDDSVRRIAVQVGYSSVSQFGAAFRKAYGKSPTEYREYNKLV